MNLAEAALQVAAEDDAIGAWLVRLGARDSRVCSPTEGCSTAVRVAAIGRVAPMGHAGGKAAVDA